ncbi:hypothetical protein GCK72_008800 [Caenorhabditis remanei]|uniref:Uncharacterized protein n=1 Tax=Caenorhabditis remanei TaxID=31234 RepID=A0A6A5H0K7_CAERE|nr:hypothetical protein GCK72_008800 [Caenorhabditis remanei]KAF1760551.1 hypothetical protein GCK72_008800 [Caenorhabditis remanei]
MGGFSKKSSRTKTKKKNSKQTRSKKRKQSVKRNAVTKSKTRTRNRSQTTSKSVTVTPTKENSEEGVAPRRKPPSNREKEFKEQEPESEGRKTEECAASKSKGSQALSSQAEQTKKVEVKNVDPDEEKMKRLLKKLKSAKKEPKAPQLPIDEKSKLLMDRVVKKPYPLKYVTKSKEELLMDEKSSFFKPSTISSNSKRHQQAVGETDSYDSFPKLADVVKMKGQNIYISDGVTPFWAEYMSPLPKDKVGIEEPVSVDQDHLEAYNEHRITLKTCNDKNPVIMNSFQPMSELRKRDELHFHDHLIFSNTVRSMVNVMSPLSSALTADARSDPIRTARDVRLKVSKSKTTATTTVGED